MERYGLPPLLTVAQVARLLRLSEDTSHRAAADGDLPTVEVDGQLQVCTKDLLAEFGIPTNARLVGRHEYRAIGEN